MKALFKGFRTAAKFFFGAANFAVNLCWIAAGIQAGKEIIGMAKHLKARLEPV